MRKTRIWAAAAATAAASLVLAGCGGGSGDGGGDSMDLWHNSTTGDGKAFWEEAAAAFEEEHGVAVNVTSVQNEDFDGRLQTAVNSGDMPDLFLQRGGGKLADMVDAGAVRDISGDIDDATREAYGDAAFSAYAIDGGTYAMPMSVLPGGIFYSKDLFAEAGIEAEPTTFDELNDAVDALKDAGIQPIALGAQDAWPAAHWYYFFALRQCDQATIESIATGVDFTDPCWLDAAESLEEFAGTEPFNEGFLTTSAQQGAGSSAGLLANHQAAMELMGGWNVGVIAGLTPDGEPLADLGWFPFPAVDGGAGDPTALMGGVDGFSCAENAHEACTDFLNFIAKDEWQEKYAQAFQSIPASLNAQSAVTDPALEPIMAAYNEAAYVVTWLDTLLGQNVGNALNTGVVEMLAGQGTPETIVETADQAAARG